MSCIKSSIQRFGIP
jgi:hypothetical protein